MRKYFLLALVLVAAGCTDSWPAGLDAGKTVSVLLVDGQTGYTGTVVRKQGGWLYLATKRGEVKIAREKVLSVKEGYFY